MIILWSLLLIAAASAHKVVESTEDIGPEAFANVTTLYPVANQSSNNYTNENTSESGLNNEKITKNTDTKQDKPKKEATSWKIEATFAESNLDKDNTATEVEQKNKTKEFRPSQHLGSFLDDNVVPTRETFDSFTPVIKKPASGFVSSKEEYRSNNIPKELLRTHKEYPYKFESTIYTRAKDSWRPDRHKPFPQGTPVYEGLGDRPGKPWSHSTGLEGFDRPRNAWGHGTTGLDNLGERPGIGCCTGSGLDSIDRPKGWGLDSLEPKPTVQSPVQLPAGGLYKYQDSFKENPRNHGEDFGLEFSNDVKENAVTKRENPWEGVMRMLTAFIPVGLIISALTPSLITIENIGPGNKYPSNVFRRSDPGAAGLPAISEKCRRRLLCELHNENNYRTAENSPSHHRKWKQCHRIRCEDTEALAKTLRWLLERQTNRQHHTA